MYTGRMEEEKIEEMFDEVSIECCMSVCVCVCVCAAHLALVHEDCVTVHEWTHCGLLTHTERDNHTEQRGRGRRRVRERNGRVGGVREGERNTHKYYTVVRMYTHQASIALYGTDMRHTPLPDV